MSNNKSVNDNLIQPFSDDNSGLKLNSSFCGEFLNNYSILLKKNSCIDIYLNGDFNLDICNLDLCNDVKVEYKYCNDKHINKIIATSEPYNYTKKEIIR